MLKPLLFFSSAFVIASATVVRAADCVYRCGSNEIQFIPGQAVQLKIVNRTGGRVSLERQRPRRGTGGGCGNRRFHHRWR